MRTTPFALRAKALTHSASCAPPISRWSTLARCGTVMKLIAAYPDAKVILNYRKDMDAWHRSATDTLVRANKHWALWLLSRLDRECFWAWHLYVDFMWPGLFRALDGNIETGIARNGRWVYRGQFRSPASFIEP